jgi:hypothetical protein
MKNKILLLIAFILLGQYAFGIIRNVPSTYATIQSALNASVAADTVLVQPGTYYENIIWPGVNSIVLLSAGDSSNTIINGNAADRVITFNGGSIDTTTVIRGFKITNGRLTVSHSYGGGIYINSSNPLIMECAITANRLDSTAQWCYGAGVYCSYSSPVFRKSSITDNITQSTSWAYGGGVHCTYNSNAMFYDCVISGNTLTGNGWAYGAGAYMTQNSSSQFINTVISANHSNDPYRCYGGGLYAEGGSSPVLINVLVAGNVMEGNAFWYYGAGVYFTGSNTSSQLMNVTIADNVRDNGATITGSGIYAESGAVVSVTNSISWNNNPGPEVYAGSATININYSCIRTGYTGTGNISNNPAFVSATDYHLQITSPCINAGTLAGAPAFDIENNPRPQPALTNPDMGCYEIDQMITDISGNESLNVRLYPNPVVNQLTLTGYGLVEEVVIEIFDATGNRVFSRQLTANPGQQISLDVYDLTDGIYFCRISSGKEWQTHRFVKQ